jgi:hypothetical protein
MLSSVFGAARGVRNCELQGALVTLALVLAMAGCSKGSTEPVTDPYAHMYGTWEGRMLAGPYNSEATDSVRVIIAPSPGQPSFRLWQLKIQSTVGYPPDPGAIWTEGSFTSMNVFLNEVPEPGYRDGWFEATSGPESDRPEGTWWARFQPLGSTVDGPQWAIVARIDWSGIPDSVGTVGLLRR